MKIAIYCQYVLGMGHLFRSLAICRALSGHDVMLVTGGPRLDIALPAHVRHFRLPPLAMDARFSAVQTDDHARSVDDIREERRQKLYRLFESEKPEIFVVELYPFGRKAFRFELDPLLKAIHDRKRPACRVVCSLRDILVEKEDPVAYEKRVLRVLNGYFNLLLVHADPTVIQLQDTFARMPEIQVPVQYTGFIAPEAVTDDRDHIRKKLGLSGESRMIVVAAGGGKVGMPLLEAVVQAYEKMPAVVDTRFYVFTGPFLDQGDFDRLSTYADDRLSVSRFTADYAQYLAAADLSISMAGYNTCMDILASGVPAWVWPFEQNREQRLRAEHLARRGVLQILENADLTPNRLAEKINAVPLRSFSALSIRPAAGIDINGAVRTAAILGPC